MFEIEELRQANLQRNRDQLKELGLFRNNSRPAPPSSNAQQSGPSSKKRKIDSAVVLPSRASARIKAGPARQSYAEKDLEERYEAIAEEDRPSANIGGRHRQTKSATKIAKPLPGPVDTAEIEALRAGWFSWKPTGPPPTRDENGTFHFADEPGFLPNKSPEEMLREGVFGGSYFRPLYSRALGTTIKDDYKELPKDWSSGLDVSRFLTSPTLDPDVNKFKVKCGQSIEEWEAAGWIAHEFDVRGWFQWYCRFFMGRRCLDDERQVGRWQRCAGENGRWRRSLLKKYQSMGIREVFDDGADEEAEDVSPVQHQTCFQWAYEIRQNDLDRFWRTGR